jgi:hypothetical protein
MRPQCHFRCDPNAIIQELDHYPESDTVHVSGGEAPDGGVKDCNKTPINDLEARNRPDSRNGYPASYVHRFRRWGLENKSSKVPKGLLQFAKKLLYFLEMNNVTNYTFS